MRALGLVRFAQRDPSTTEGSPSSCVETRSDAASSRTGLASAPGQRTSEAAIIGKRSTYLTEYLENRSLGNPLSTARPVGASGAAATGSSGRGRQASEHWFEGASRSPGTNA